MPPKGRRAASAPGGGRSREWGHPEGTPLSEIDLNYEYDGVVTNVGPFGVFVDFGAVKDGLLRVPVKVGRSLKRGMEVTNMTVLSCDPDSGKVVLQPDENFVPQQPSVPRRTAARGGGDGGGARGTERRGGGGGGGGARGGGGRGGGGGGGGVRTGGRAGSRSVSQGRTRTREWGHADATPLEELREGDVYDGTVTNVSPAGVFVDIGAARDARLGIPARIGRMFSIGDFVPKCRLEVIDLDKGRIGCVPEEMEETVRDLPPKVRAKGKAKAANPKARAASASPPPTRRAASLPPREELPQQSHLIPLERLRVGSTVDGVVSNKGRFGVFVNIGCTKDARLNVPWKVGAKFSRGDEVYGMVVENVDLDKNQISVSMEDPELADDAAEVPKANMKGRGALGDAPARKAVAQAPQARRQQAVPSTKVRESAARQPSPKAPLAKAQPPPGPGAKEAKAVPPQQKDWSALPVEGFEVGAVADGVVTSIRGQNVFIDIGWERDGVLRLAREVARQFQVGDEVHGMTVDSVDVERGKITLALEDPELEQPEPVAPGRPPAAPPARQEATPKGPTPQRAAKAKPKAAGVKAAAKATPRRKKEWSHPDGMPLSDLEVGAEVNGTVTNVGGQFGIFLDIGATKDGKLRIQQKDMRKFRVGDQVQGMIIEHVDPDTEQITLGLPYDIGEGPVEQPPPRPKAVATGGAGRRSDGRAVRPSPLPRGPAGRSQGQGMGSGPRR